MDEPTEQFLGEMDEMNAVSKIVPVAVAGVVGALIFSALHAPSDASDQTAERARSQQINAQIKSMVPSSALSRQALAWARSEGLTVTVPDQEKRSQAVLGTEDALRQAVGDFAFVADGTVDGMELVLFTDPKYGKELEPDVTKPSKITPILQDRLVWMIEVSDFVPFVSAPLRMDEKQVATNTAPKANGKGFVMVDAVSGDVVRAVQY